jgi:hypothetical protein
MEEFWKLEPGIIKVVSQKNDRSEILIVTTKPIKTQLETFINSTKFIEYSNAYGFWELDEMSLETIFYSPICDDPILRGDIN